VPNFSLRKNFQVLKKLTPVHKVFLEKFPQQTDMKSFALINFVPGKGILMSPWEERRN